MAVSRILIFDVIYLGDQEEAFPTILRIIFMVIMEPVPVKVMAVVVIYWQTKQVRIQ